MNPIVNAVTEDNFAAALEDADAADREAAEARRSASREAVDEGSKRKSNGALSKNGRIRRSSSRAAESAGGATTALTTDSECNHSPAPEIHREVAVGRGEAGGKEGTQAGRQEDALTRLARERPLLGVPFTVKLCFAVRGKLWSSGLYSRRDVRAHEDADVVCAMRRAGAVLLCVTNMPDLGMWTETHNWQFGRTSNPYDTWRTSGGSSGGEGALVSVHF